MATQAHSIANHRYAQLFACLSSLFNHLSLIMQNKPNLLYTQMNVNSVNTRDYENKFNWKLGENKPNSNPIKPNQTQFKPNQTQKNKSKIPISPQIAIFTFYFCIFD